MSGRYASSIQFSTFASMIAKCRSGCVARASNLLDETIVVQTHARLTKMLTATDLRFYDFEGHVPVQRWYF
jgi:hypothetical protein